MEELVRSLYKDADQKNIDFSSEKRPVTIFRDGVARGVIIPTYANLLYDVQSLTNELNDWKEKYRILSRERTMLDQELHAQRKLTEMYREQMVKYFNIKIK